MPVGRAVRAAHRGNARGDRAAPRAAARRAPVPPAAVLAPAVSGAPARCSRCRSRSSTCCAAGRGCWRCCRARLRNLIALAPDATLSALTTSVPERTPAAGATRAARRPADRLRAARVLRRRQRGDRAGARGGRLRGARARAAQGCCGALALHAGPRRGRARIRARADRDVRTRPTSTSIVVNAAGCGSAMKEIRRAVRGRSGVGRARAGVLAPRSATSPKSSPGSTRRGRPGIRSTLRVAYHDACHLPTPRASGSSRARAGVDSRRHVVPIAESDICCGSAGIFNLVQPEMAAELGRRKAANDRRSQAGRRRHVESGLHAADRRRADEPPASRRPVLHIVELLDASIRGERPASMIIDPTTVPANDQLPDTVGAVVPRPIAFVSTMSQRASQPRAVQFLQRRLRRPARHLFQPDLAQSPEGHDRQHPRHRRIRRQHRQRRHRRADEHLLG